MNYVDKKETISSEAELSDLAHNSFTGQQL